MSRGYSLGLGLCYRIIVRGRSRVYISGLGLCYSIFEVIHDFVIITSIS